MMGFKREVTRTGFYTELSEEKREEYLGIKCDKFYPTIDNIYYSVFIEGDSNDNPLINPLLDKLDKMKAAAIQMNDKINFGNGLMVDFKVYKLYKYCLSQPDLFDIFVLSYLPNDKTPRILIQIRSEGLWTKTEERMLSESYHYTEQVLSGYYMKIERCRENRIDYCYHTNIISNPEKLLNDETVKKQLHTTMEKWCQMGDIEKTDEGTILHKDYFSLGNRSSNYVFTRIYNKTKEVIQMGYKGFFFEIWKDKGLISFYDRFCMEVALEKKSYNYLDEGKLRFYLKYGTNDEKKREFKAALENPCTTVKKMKDLARGYMPEVTTITNIEFETKRKYYYYSDKFIPGLTTKERFDMPEKLEWLYKIIDNRGLFLEYLTSKTVSFRDEEDKEKYVWWWEHLRNTKLDVIKTDEKLVREYTRNLDERLTRVRLINSIATNAVYNDNVDSDFVEDVSDILSSLNDNNKVKIVTKQKGSLIKGIDNELLEYYHVNKLKKEKRLKNRKKEKPEV